MQTINVEENIPQRLGRTTIILNSDTFPEGIMPQISEDAHMGVMEATSIATQEIYATTPCSPIESRASNFEVNLDWHPNPLYGKANDDCYIGLEWIAIE